MATEGRLTVAKGKQVYFTCLIFIVHNCSKLKTGSDYFTITVYRVHNYVM